MSTRRLALALLLTSSAPGLAAERALTADEYARFVALVGDRLEAGVRAQQPGDAAAAELLVKAFTTLAQHRFPGAIAVGVLSDLHFSEAQLQAFIDAHPDLVLADTATLSKRLERAMEVKAAHMPPRPPPPARAPTIDVDAAVRAATRAHRDLLLVYEAEWCLACKDLERTLADASVRARLADTDVKVVDVTNDDDPRVKAATRRFHADTLPMLILVRAGKERLRLDRAVTPQELLAALPR
jgi:thiol:disulfide interchange protein